jgi:protein-S-isoprenylcysteine O-methyltransferase Ste14
VTRNPIESRAWFRYKQAVPFVSVWLPVISTVVIYLARLQELRTKRDTERGPVKETLTFRLFVLTGTGMVAGAVVEYLVCQHRLNWPTFLAGWVCALASFFIRRRAIAALGKFWSLHVEIREHHQFVQTGPFRWVRHPTYFSMILELLSAGLLLSAKWSLLAAGLLFIPALIWRVRLEEQALVEKFGDAYRAYQCATPAVIPYRWCK